VLVGDSLGMVVQGRNSTLAVTLDETAYHLRCVARGNTHAWLIGDLPFGSYEESDDLAVASARRFIDAGCDAVKLEGAGPMLARVAALVAAGIAVMGHVGLVPQHARSPEEFRAQGRDAASAASIVNDAVALEEAGCFAVVLEAVPAPVATAISRRLEIPTIGIGSGGGTDGQVLVLHDMLGIRGDGPEPRFVKRYAEVGELMATAVAAYAEEVRSHAYPGDEHTYSIADDQLAEFQAAVDAGSINENTLADW
jgi:3-methyl-2-oxobutanoate hydroxymethyltransferase